MWLWYGLGWRGPYHGAGCRVVPPSWVSCLACACEELVHACLLGRCKLGHEAECCGPDMVKGTTIRLPGRPHHP